jgi:hypothetical protein
MVVPTACLLEQISVPMKMTRGERMFFFLFSQLLLDA